MAAKGTTKQKGGAGQKPTARKRANRGGDIERGLVRATAALKKEFEKVRAKMTRLRNQGSEAFDELYEEIGRVLEGDPPLRREIAASSPVQPKQG